MAEGLVLRTVTGGVAIVTLNRPAKLNALTAELFDELHVHLTELASDETVHCLVLAGAGRSFCAGHDLTTVATDESLTSRFFEAETIDTLEAFPVPTIAKIQGHCLTGGLELALACDLAIAGENAKLGDTHGKWGLVPVWGMSIRLPERIGQARAKELSFTGRVIDGGAAAAIGLVDACVPEGELDEAVAELSAKITANSPGSNRIYKSLYAQRQSMSRHDALCAERALPFGLPADSAQRLAAGR